MRSWRRPNYLLAIASICGVAFVGNLVAAWGSTLGVNLVSVLGGSIASLVFFSPLLLLFVGIPLWLYQSRLARVGNPTRRQAILTAPAFFLPGVLVALALLALDGTVQSSSVYAVVLIGTFGVSMLFGAIARLPVAPEPPSSRSA